MIRKPHGNVVLALAGALLLIGIGFMMGRVGYSPKAVRASVGDQADNHSSPDSSVNKSGIVIFDQDELKLSNLGYAHARYQLISSGMKVTGTVQPNQNGVFLVTSRVPGKVLSLNVGIGDNVRAGEPLATLASMDLARAQAAYRDSMARIAVAWNDLQRQRKLAKLGAFAAPPLESARMQVANAESDVSTAQSAVTDNENKLRVIEANLVQAKAQFNLTQSTLHRDESLYKAEFISKQELDVAQASYQSAMTYIDAARARVALEKSRIRSAKRVVSDAVERNKVAMEALTRERGIYNGGYITNQQIVAAEATLQQAKLDTSAAANAVRLMGGTPGGGDVIPVRAPFGGHVTERPVTPGETVPSGETLYQIINLNTVWVELNLYPNTASMVHVGQRVTITSNNNPGCIIPGIISYIGEAMDPTTHTTKVRCVLRNGNDRLKLGEFVEGDIIKPPANPVLVAPKEAIQDYNGNKMVFKVGDKPGEFIACPVKVGDTVDGVTEIRAGLKSGDRIVTKNAFIVESQAIKSAMGGGR